MRMRSTCPHRCACCMLRPYACTSGCTMCERFLSNPRRTTNLVCMPLLAADLQLHASHPACTVRRTHPLTTAPRTIKISIRIQMRMHGRFATPLEVVRCDCAGRFQGTLAFGGSDAKSALGVGTALRSIKGSNVKGSLIKIAAALRNNSCSGLLVV